MIAVGTLGTSRLRRILAAYTVNRLGTWVGVVALSLAVYDRTHNALAVAALLVAAQVLPAFAVPVVVARVEASPRRGELSGLYVFEGVVTAALAVLLHHFWLPAVLLLAALDGTAALAASALLRTEVARAGRELLAEHELLAVDALAGDGAGAAATDGPRTGATAVAAAEAVHAAEQRANAALNVAFSATFVIGPALGGAIVGAWGASTALVLDAATFLACGALLVDLHPHVEEAGGASVAARLRAAWRHIQAAPTLRGLLAAQGFGLVFFESVGPIEVAYAKSTLHAGDRGYGVLLAMWGVGSVLGSLVFARSSTRSLRTMLSAGTLAVGAAYLGFAAAPSLGVACVAAVVGGVGNGVQWPSVISGVQRLTPPDMQGRVMGALESVGAISPAAGLALGGGLVALASPRVAFTVAGVGAAVTTAWFARLVFAPGAAAPAPAAGAVAGEPSPR